MSLEELNRMVLSMCGDPRLVTMWWTTQNRAFHYATPQEVYEYDPDRVESYIMEHYQP